MKDEIYERIRREALEALEDEPELSTLLHRTILAPGVDNFEDAIATTVCYRLLLAPCGKTPNNQQTPVFCPNSLRAIIGDAMKSEELEAGHSMSEAVRQDILATFRRDPACDTYLEAVLFFKGFSALVCHRAARRKWMQAVAKGKKSFTALFLQSQASSVFGVDIHPAATIGAGIMMDHATGIVIGETAVVLDGCTLLHGVTLGGTGKDHGDRHPKLGRGVLVGCQTSILGNIKIGDYSKIGASSVVLRDIPSRATAVGSPARIIGKALESDPGEEVDDTLKQVGLLHHSISSATVATDILTEEDYESSGTEDEQPGELVKRQSHFHRPSLAPQVKSSSNDELDCPMCPYREFKRLSLSAPPGVITIYSLFDMLQSTGASTTEMGAAFMDLDAKNVGYVHWKYFVDHAVDVITRNIPSVTAPTVQSLMDEYARNHPELRRGRHRASMPILGKPASMIQQSLPIQL